MKNRLCYFIPADGYVEDYGFRVSVVRENEVGHHPTGTWPNDGAQQMPYFWGDDYLKACELAKQQNEKLGHTDKDVSQIITSSIAQGDPKIPITPEMRKDALAFIDMMEAMDDDDKVEESMTTRKQRILNTAEDFVSNFLYYDRKEDEDLPRGQIEEAIQSGEISVDEIIGHIRQKLVEGLDR